MSELSKESERLARSWKRHPAEWLRDYLVAGVEDPRLNLQSILSRHFLLRALTGERFQALCEEEYRFSAVMNWLAPLAARNDAAELDAVRYALRQGADNAEGLEIPRFVLQTFRALPARAGEMEVPNYIATFLEAAARSGGETQLCAGGLNCFQQLWREALSGLAAPARAPSVLEPACGSANDYRFVRSFGLARFLEYSGFDLCDTNVANARALFPDVRFQVANVFALEAEDKSFDLCFVHDLFEHLSLDGLAAALREVCRVTRKGICVGFFQMDETSEHRVRPVEEYFCNLLSMERMRAAFAGEGFVGQVLHIDSFLRQHVGVCAAHNPNAYTFWLHAS